LCALKVPFDGHDLKSLIQKITKAPTPKLPAEYSKAVQDILNKLLSRDPSARPEAGEILGMSVVRDTVKKMNKGMQNRESASECSAAPQKEQPVEGSVVSSAQYSDSAGTFSKRDKVEYHSATHCEWLPAIVTAVDAKGQILMDVKPNTWLSMEVQAEKVRPRQLPASADEKREKRPSSARAPPKAVHSGGAAEPKPQSARRCSAPCVGQRPSAPPPPALSARQGKKPDMRRPSSDREVPVSGKYARSPRNVVAAHLGA